MQPGTPGRDCAKAFAGFGEHGFGLRQVLDAADDYVAVSRADLHAAADAAEHFRGSDRSSAAAERIEDHVSSVRKCLDEELDQLAREGSRVRSLAALGLDFDHVRRPRDPTVAAFEVVGIAARRLPRTVIPAA